MYEHQFRHGLVVRIAGSHPAGPGSIPGAGTYTFYKQAIWISNVKQIVGACKLCLIETSRILHFWALNPLAICFYSHTKKWYYIVPSCKSSSFCSVNLKPLWQGHGLENLHMELTYVECSLVIYLHLNLHPKSTSYLTIPTVEYRYHKPFTIHLPSMYKYFNNNFLKKLTYLKYS